MTNTSHPRCFAALLLWAVYFSTGCRPPAKLVPVEVPAADTAIRLGVVDDAALAAALRVPKSEWKARHGSRVEVLELTAAELLDAPPPALDAVIYPAELLGGLIADRRIAPLPQGVLESSELAWNDVFPVVQRAAAWGNRVYAVPFGMPTFVLLYRSDVLEKLGLSPPQTWSEFQQLAGLLSDRKKLGELAPAADEPWQGSLEPLAWGGRLLLARAAAYARHRDHYSTLFNIDDLSPLIDGPPFVRALEELVRAARLSPDGPARLDPAAVREAFFAGHCALAVSWPTAAGANTANSRGLPHSGFAELPGAEQSFNFAARIWDVRNADEDVHVPLVPIAGRIGSVIEGTGQIDAAARLLAWLSGTEWGAQVAPHSDQTTLYRRSQVDAPQAWVERGLPPADAKQYAAAVQESLTRKVWVDALRIPGAADYHRALDRAVEQALAGELTPAAALQQAAAQWRQLNERFGMERQRLAYRQSLGLEP